MKLTKRYVIFQDSYCRFRLGQVHDEGVRWIGTFYYKEHAEKLIEVLNDSIIH